MASRKRLHPWIVGFVFVMFGASGKAHAQSCPNDTSRFCPSPIFSEWRYGNAGEYQNEADMIAGQIKFAQRADGNECPIRISIEPWNNWPITPFWVNGSAQQYDLSQYASAISVNTDPINAPRWCPAVVSGLRYMFSFKRSRTVTCPTGTILIGSLTSDQKSVLTCLAPPCPVPPLTNFTDPDFQKQEAGVVDTENLTKAAHEGAECIIREANAAQPKVGARINPGYRPATYQTHLREIYDKWQLLKGSQMSSCELLKRVVEEEYRRHGPFAHQPGLTSRHSSGAAVDIDLSDYSVADNLARTCGMWRPYGNSDRPHFEPIR